MSNYLDVIRERVVVFDGAMGTNLQLCDLSGDDFGGSHLEGCNEVLVRTRPEIVQSVHELFLKAGVDVLETNSFGSFAVPLAEYGLADEAYDLSLRAAQLAKEVVTSFDSEPRWVAGSIGPGTKMPTLGHIAFAELRDAYETQARGLLDGGVDLLLIETQYDLLGAKAAIVGCRKAMSRIGREVPIQVQVTIESTGRMLPGTEIGAAYVALRSMRPDVLGINCATGPTEMNEHVRYLAQHCDLPIAVLPNAGLPSVVDGKMRYDLSPETFANQLLRFVREHNVNVIGGCCGTTPDHLRAVVQVVKGIRPQRRHTVIEPSITSLYSPVTLQQELSYLAVGERTNANGSKQFREAMLNGDWNACLDIARTQVRDGAHVLDLCVDYVGRDGKNDMHELAARLSTDVAAPLMLDSTEPDVLEAGLQHIGGRSVLNSANLEDGDGAHSRAQRVFDLARTYGAVVVCLLIDEEGQARDVDWKLRVAHRLYDMATTRFGLAPQDILFDTLTFPLSTGDDALRNDAMHTIEAIKRIKEELPGVQCILGVSNVSFGLSPAIRHVLNSVFLFEAQQAGLDAAIVNAARIVPIHKIDDEVRTVCLDLIYNRCTSTYDPLKRLLELFADTNETPVTQVDRATLPLNERLKLRIVDGDMSGLEDDLDSALQEGMNALDIINVILLDGMKTVGELFGAGKMQLPFVLKSAETMKRAVAHLEPHMPSEGSDGSEVMTKGRVVLATVKGDVHDIGKNLVDIILSNNGYQVHNLGIKVSINEMIEKAIETDADMIGMSGLLVKSTLIMRENLEELNARGCNNISVILGGAALNRTYVERDLREVYNGRVFYGRDAFEGLSTLDKLIQDRSKNALDPDWGRAPGGRNISRRATVQHEQSSHPLQKRSPVVEDDNRIFHPPFLGARIERGIPLDDIAMFLNETTLFRNQWQFRPTDGETDEEFKARLRPQLRDALAEAKQTGVLVPQVAYGYWPANSEGNTLLVFADETRGTVLETFSFPREGREPYRCIADFFRPFNHGDGDIDYAAFQIVTMGARVSESTAQLFADNHYQRYLTLHGLGVEMAEALAEYWHHRVRAEWGFVDEDGPSLTGLFRQQYRGGRYSWGYPACPDLEDNGRVANLVGAKHIGVTVSSESSWQFHPEQSTSAIICHHPKAKYFVAEKHLRSR